MSRAKNTFASELKFEFVNVIIFLLCVSLLVASGFLIAYLWGVKSGQFEDDYSPAHKIFFDDVIKEQHK